MDVYGCLRMAPRAGFEIDRKYMTRKDGGFAKHADTPSNTPESQCTF